MNDDYIFPENNWYIEITNNNRKLLNDWKIQQQWCNDLFTYTSYKFVANDGAGFTDLKCNRRIKITIDQFEEYVLNIKNENYNYLIELLNKLNIK